MKLKNSKKNNKKFRFELPEIEDPYALADWIEVMMLLYQKPKISKTDIANAISANTGISKQELEAPIGFLFSEITRRRQLVGAGYPLAVEGTSITFDSESNHEFYKFLLLISQDGPMRIKRRFKEVDKLFDDLVAESVKNYLGEGTKTIRFAWPPSDGRPSNFKRAITWLCEKTGIPEGVGEKRANSKDGGVDVVAWKPFSDHPRSAFIVAYVQSTIMSDWFMKSRDIVDDVWSGHIDVGKHVLISLAIPFMIRSDFEKWDELRRTVNIVFDRLRLVQMLSNSDISPFADMVRWNNKEIKRYNIMT